MFKTLDVLFDILSRKRRHDTPGDLAYRMDLKRQLAPWHPTQLGEGNIESGTCGLAVEVAREVEGVDVDVGGGEAGSHRRVGQRRVDGAVQADDDGIDQPGTPAPPRFLDRLSPRLGSELIALEMEDHYVRIRTEHGSRLEMGPLARVTAMLSGVEGLQTHRSWWVARRAITGVERDGRNLRLRLVDGETAPVSRASVAASLRGAS